MVSYTIVITRKAQNSIEAPTFDWQTPVAILSVASVASNTYAAVYTICIHARLLSVACPCSPVQLLAIPSHTGVQKTKKHTQVLHKKISAPFKSRFHKVGLRINCTKYTYTSCMSPERYRHASAALRYWAWTTWRFMGSYK